MLILRYTFKGKDANIHMYVCIQILRRNFVNDFTIGWCVCEILIVINSKLFLCFTIDELDELTNGL